jgi:hypothetical protein
MIGTWSPNQHRPRARQGLEPGAQHAGHAVGVAQMTQVDGQLVAAGRRRRRIEALRLTGPHLLEMQGPVVLHGDDENEQRLLAALRFSREQTFSATARSPT